MKTTKLGRTREDGARQVFFLRDGAWMEAGWQMPGVTDEVLAASPGIQSHSKPGGARDVVMADPSSVASFAAHWERKWATTYPLCAS